MREWGLGSEGWGMRVRGWASIRHIVTLPCIYVLHAAILQLANYISHIIDALCALPPRLC